MKTMKILFAVMIGCGLLWQACQKDEESMESYKDVETSLLKSDIEEFDCNVDCIDPDEPEYFIVHHELLIGWAGPDNNKFNKTVEVKYYNTLTHFVLKVMSTNGIADVLMDDESIKNFEGTIPPHEWHEFSFELEADWEACDIWAFELKIAGFGPPAYFDVEYQLIGECTINPDAFITKWDTNLWTGTTVTLGLAGQVNATIDWGDGTITSVTTPGPHTHDYGTDGTYTVSVTGQVTEFGGYHLDQYKLISVENWGQLGFISMAEAFHHSTNLITVPDNTIGLENVTNMEKMFLYSTFFNQDLSGWDVSNVNNMAGMFWDARSFNHDLSGWDVSNVTNMERMFLGASSFNQDINGWDVSKVTNMSSMFSLSPLFNHDLSGWDVSNVTNMERMFSSASSFNQDINGWDVSNVTNMEYMFSRSSSFNQDLCSWDVSNVTNMCGMFYYALSFNQDIGGWDVSNVTNMQNLFTGAVIFNQNISEWDVSNVTNMQYMFFYASLFNQNIGEWDVSNVQHMFAMFYNASSFNQDLSNWCVSQIASQPNLFDSNASSWMLPRPVWGTCP